MKKNLSKKNSEIEKLEKIAGVKLKAKPGTAEEIMLPFGDVEAANIRMYETHVPGFCYLRNGECRKRTLCTVSSTNPDPLECSEKVKAIIFTNDELDVGKTMCLHLLGTQVQSRAHIQRKDGRLCSYIKAQTIGNAPCTLQPFLQRTPNKVASKYDKMLPRYVLDVKHLNRGISNASVKTYDFDSGGSDEETKKKRKLQVPIYTNYEISIIIQSVMEALEAVNSPKLKAIINLASSPEELRNMLKNEDLRDFIIELSSNPLITKPTSYDFIMTHLMFDKIPEKGTLESVAQVLEVSDNTELQKSLYQIQKAIFQRHKELAESNIIPKIKGGIQEKVYPEMTKILNPYSATAGFKNVEVSNSTNISKKECKDILQKVIKPSAREDKASKNENLQKFSSTKINFSNKSSSKNVSINLENIIGEECNISKDNLGCDENYFSEENRGSFQQIRSSSIDSNKYSFQNLTNPQRILFGLKVASLKCKPINMHQLEGKKKIDLNAVLAPILYAQESDSELKHHSSLQAQISSFSAPNRKLKKSASNITEIHTSILENLSRALLTNLRLEISESENKKRINQFMADIS